jgi:hypothetical protein
MSLLPQLAPGGFEVSLPATVGRQTYRRGGFASSTLPEVFARFGAFRRTVPCVKSPVPRDADDHMIVSLLLAREPSAVELLYDRWSSVTYALALRIVHDPAEAEKVVLEAYMTLWRHPEVALEHYDSLRAYLCALIACDARLRYLRSRPRYHDVRTVCDTPLGAIHPAPHAVPANVQVVG